MDKIQNEQFKAFLKMVNWKPRSLPPLIPPEGEKEHIPFLDSINEYLRDEAEKSRLLLPKLNNKDFESIAIYSDYGGEHPESDYYTYSILICGYEDRIAFPVQMEKVRKKHKIGDREIGFKKFDSVSLRNALPEYLYAADNLVIGLLFTLIVSKELPTLFGSKQSHQIELAKILNENNLGKWKPQIAEKLLRITHLTAYLIGLLCEQDQKLFWMTDHDAIAPNNPQQNMRMDLLQRILPLYTKNQFKLIGGAVPFQERSIAHLDFLSLTDVVAGSVEHYFTNSGGGGKEAFVKKGADDVLNWLAHDGVSLKKKTFFIDGQADSLQIKDIDFLDNRKDHEHKIVEI